MDFDYIENINVRMFVKFVVEHSDSLEEIRDTGLILLSHSICSKLVEVVGNDISDDL